MSHDTLLVFELTILVLAIFLGFEVISKVPTLLHTPLMSGTNAIHGIVIVGAMIVLGVEPTRTRSRGSSASSRSCSRPRTSSAASWSPTGCSRCSRSASRRSGTRSELEHRQPALPDHDRHVHPRAALPLQPGQRAARRIRSARRGCCSRSSSRGSRIGTTSWWAIALGMLIGGGFGAVAARKVRMTAMPQMVALFNGVGGGAAALIALAELHRILPPPGAPEGRHLARDRALRADRRRSRSPAR